MFNIPPGSGTFASSAIFGLYETISTRLQAPWADLILVGVEIHGHYLLEGLLVVIIVWLLSGKSHKPQKKPLSKQEVDQLCEEWVPEPLHPPLTKEQLSFSPPVLTSAATPRTKGDGWEAVNLTANNFLGLLGNAEVRASCEATLRKYGVGACGPRGFYGTIDVHLDLEKRIATFMGTEDAILYSYGLATNSSAIPAFCKRGDLVIADEAVNWGIQNGLALSRSTVKYFRHNDLAHLETLLAEVKEEDRRKPKALNRRFIVVEAIYQNTGQMVPMDEIIRLKEQYCFRVLVDESLSLGVLGKTGRGITENFGIPVEKVDIITAGLGNAMASVGGFCCGSSQMVNHQRLSGLGYCFSASLPPFLASATITGLDILEREPQLLLKLRKNVAVLRKALAKVTGLVTRSHEESPLIHLHLKNSKSFEEDTRVLQQIVDAAFAAGFLISTAKRSMLDRCSVPASIRLSVSAGHTQADLQGAATAIKRACEKIL